MRNCYQTKLGSTCLDAVKPTCWHWVMAKQERKKRKKVKSFSCVRLFVTPRTVAYQAPPSMGFCRQEYWSGLPFPSPGDLSDPGIEPRFPALQQILYHLSHQRTLGQSRYIESLHYWPKTITTLLKKKKARVMKDKADWGNVPDYKRLKRHDN